MVTEKFHPVRRICVLCLLFDDLRGLFFLQTVSSYVVTQKQIVNFVHYNTVFT
jgi:hypothetical protein